jgi:hypothetical protein
MDKILFYLALNPKVESVVFFIAYGIIFNSKGIISIFAKYKKQKC